MQKKILGYIGNIKSGTYYLDTGWACGCITIKNGVIVQEKTAPIFRNLNRIGKDYRIKKMKGIAW